MNPSEFSGLAFGGETVVSRETMERLETYHELLVKWNRKINLVSSSTLNDAWTRHFADSAQLWRFHRIFSDWIDLGSGAGFPGLVLATIAAEKYPDATFHLVESDARKCAFLRTVVRETGARATIHNVRIDDLTDVKADVLSARALAPLGQLLVHAEKLLRRGGNCLFLKGKNYDTEIREASKTWSFNHDGFSSLTDPKARILDIKDLKRAPHLRK